MTTATKTRSPSAELAKLEKVRDDAHAKARAARAQMEAWERELPVLRAELSAHFAAHPDEVEGVERRPKAGTTAAKLSSEIKQRISAENPHRPAYEQARDTFHEHDRRVEEFKLGNVKARIAELDGDFESATAKIQSGAEELLRGLEAILVHHEEVTAIIVDTPRLNGQAVKGDNRISGWYETARQIVDTNVERSGLAHHADYRLNR